MARSRRLGLLWSALTAVTLVGIAGPGTAWGAPRQSGVMVYQRDEELGGVHWRLRTLPGAVHVWQPSGYQARSAGLVVYVHGLGSSPDKAWQQSRLARRFQASGRNALFVVPDGPGRDGPLVRWPDLAALLRTVAACTDARLPAGHVVAVAHSSGYQTVARWTSHPRLREIILLDGLYGQQEAFTAWLARDEAHRLVLVAARSRGLAEAWIRGIPFVERRERIPERSEVLRAEELMAPLLYLRSQYGHQELARVDSVLPVLLQATLLGPCLW